MNEFSHGNYAGRLRQLTDDYCRHHIAFAEYRQLRKQILDQLDEELNGVRYGSPEDRPKASVMDKAAEFFQKQKN